MAWCAVGSRSMSVPFAMPMSVPIPKENGCPAVENGAATIEEKCYVFEDKWKWRLLLAYDGTKYAGWQYQKRPPTVQCVVGDALTKLTKLGRKELCLVGASRTDAGVHAWGQVAHFTTPFLFDQLESLHAGLNGILPHDIRVREITAVKTGFHARYSARKKTYHYKICNDAIMDPFQHSYAYHCANKLNVDVMKQAANHFIGLHDFSAFITMSNDDLPRDPRREIFRFDVVKMDANLQLEIEGSGFFHKQVRNMVALLLEIGKEAIPQEIVLDVLASRPDVDDNKDYPDKESRGLDDIIDLCALLKLDGDCLLAPQKPHQFLEIYDPKDNMEDQVSSFYSKVAQVKGPKSGKEVEALDAWIHHFADRKKEPFRLAHLLLAKAAAQHNLGEMEFPESAQEFLVNWPSTCHKHLECCR